MKVLELIPDWCWELGSNHRKRIFSENSHVQDQCIIKTDAKIKGFYYYDYFSFLSSSQHLPYVRHHSNGQIFKLMPY